jgi:hypothetical protein
MQKNDCRDWFVMLLFANLAVAATVYLFLHPSNIAYGTWGSILSTTGVTFHWLTVRDAKVPDACSTPSS